MWEKAFLKSLGFPVYFEAFNRFSISIQPFTQELPHSTPHSVTKDADTGNTDPFPLHILLKH